MGTVPKETVRPEPTAAEPGRRLDSWKEIAQYLNRDVRTVQRWERTNALPIHRMARQGHKRGAVYAYETELAAWLRPSQAASSLAGGPRRRRGVLAVAFVGISLIAAFGLWRWWVREPRSSPAFRVLPVTDYPGVEQFPSFSPDGNGLAFSWNGRNQDNFDIYVKTLPSGVPQRLTSDPAFDGWPAWSPDGRSIALVRLSRGRAKAEVMVVPAQGGPEQKVAEFFARNDRGPKVPTVGWADSRRLIVPDTPTEDSAPGLAMVDLETRETKPLISPPPGSRGDCCPALSPDSRTLAFLRSSEAGVWNLFVVRLDGPDRPEQAPRQLTSEDSGAWNPMWTADGRQLLYRASHQGTWMLWRVQRDGSRPPQQVNSVGPIGAHWTISRQGNRLAYRSNLSRSEIWRVGEGGKELTRLVSSRANYFNPQYSPDGTSISFITHRLGILRISVSRQDGREVRELDARLGPRPAPARWSPDSRQVVFECQNQGNDDICAAPVVGGTVRRLTSNPAEDRFPSWSHDGKWVYFTSKRSGSAQIWKLPAEGGEAGAVQLTKDGGFSPVESADGLTVYYAKHLFSAPLWAVPAAGGVESRVGSFHLLGLADQFVVSPKGIHYISSANPEQWFEIRLYRFSTGRSDTVARIEKRPGEGLSVSGDGRWILFPAAEEQFADLFLVENFR